MEALTGIRTHAFSVATGWFTSRGAFDVRFTNLVITAQASTLPWTLTYTVDALRITNGNTLVLVQTEALLAYSICAIDVVRITNGSTCERILF